jgi:hypothetical protein
MRHTTALKTLRHKKDLIKELQAIISTTAPDSAHTQSASP